MGFKKIGFLGAKWVPTVPPICTQFAALSSSVAESAGPGFLVQSKKK
jgi:hypothetical protein